MNSMDLAERIADGDEPTDMTGPQKKNLVEFVRVIRKIRVQAKNVRLTTCWLLFKLTALSAGCPGCRSD